MNNDDPLPTRASLLDRLRDSADHGSWSEFHQLYRGLLQGVARQAGLTEHEADEAVQEILIALARKLPEFRYDPSKDSFKGWLLQIARWKVADQFRKRGAAPWAPPDETHLASSEAQAEPTQPTDLADGWPGNPDGPSRSDQFDQIWESEWERHLLDQALAVVKRQASPAHYAIYHLYVLEEQTIETVRRTLGVSAGQIYLAKHRVGGLLKRELRRLRRTAG